MFEQISIVGVGLLGSSLGMAIRERKLAKRVVGVGRRQFSLDIALEKGAIDVDCLDLVEGVQGSDCVVLAGPAALVNPMLDTIRPVIGAECVVSDVASTKADIAVHANKTWEAPRKFIGAHPLAGAELFGPKHGRADFYAGSVCLVEEGKMLDEEAREKVCALWEAVGSEVVSMDPKRHDDLLAYTSHVPHILATTMASVAGQQGDIRKFIGNGFKDTTRIADGRPEIWRDISLTNRKAIVNALGGIQEHLESFIALLEAGDEAALDAFFEDARQVRSVAVHGEEPEEEVVAE